MAQLKGRLDRPLTGAALGMGIISFWIYTQFIPVPFINIINQMQRQYLTFRLGVGTVYGVNCLYTN